MSEQSQRRKKVPSPSSPALTLVPGISAVQLADDGAERSVLGAVLQQPDLYWSLSERLQATDFFYLKHRWVWFAFEQLAASKQVIDLETVPRWLDRQADAPIKGDDALGLVADLWGQRIVLEHAEIYAGHVREAALRLRGLEAGRRILELMNDTSKPVQQVVDEANRTLFEATDQRFGLEDTSAASAAAEYLALMQARVMREQRPGVAYGFEKFDNPVMATGGLYPGDVTVLCGHEGYGKTTFALSVAHNALRAGKSVVVFTLEMRRDENLQVLMSQETGIPKSTLRDGTLSGDEFDTMATACRTIAAWNLHIVDEFRNDNPLTPLTLKRRLRVLLARQTVDMVVIDGLWLMEADGERERGGKERWQAVNQIMYGLADIAKGEAGLPMPILITQQYRGDAYMAKEPDLSLIAESAGVRRTAMVIIGLWRNTASGRTEAHILKDRAGGNRGYVGQFTFNKSFSCYEEC